jgi:hypothetical protein
MRCAFMWKGDAVKHRYSISTSCHNEKSSRRVAHPSFLRRVGGFVEALNVIALIQFRRKTKLKASAGRHSASRPN